MDLSSFTGYNIFWEVSEMSTKAEITKSVLARSIKSLLRQKTLDKISIKELVAESGLNRQTFYYHFDDIYHLIEWTFRNETMSIFKSYSGSQIWQEGLKRFLQDIENNRIMCQNVLNAMSIDKMAVLFYEDLSGIVVKAIEDLADGYELEAVYKKQLTLYFTISLAGMVEAWTYQKIDMTSDELVNFLDTIIKDQIKGIQIRLIDKTASD